MSEAVHILKQYWGYREFRPGQEEIIQAVCEGNDVLALLPTGGGKSICYQVPVMMKEGMGLVISPLIALMKDQVEGLRRKGITAFAIFSGMDRKELIHTLKVASESNCKFLFVSPERLETKLFQEYLPGLHINVVAVDEAHCISQWGYDFRPPYLRIASIRQQLPGVPVLALTASATSDVERDIIDKLTLLPNKWKVFRQSFERANLSYSVFDPVSKSNKITDILEKVPGTSIVYCRSRKKTKELAQFLQFKNIAASFYHAGLNTEERTRRQQEWIGNSIRVMVSTNAFGMGIDKPDVRTVIHADVPDCLENYYQEAGRAGRDGKKSYAVLLYEEKDIDDLRNFINARFPSLEDIRTVYQAVANYLQVPAGSGEATYHDFDIADFLKKFKLDPSLVINSLKVLEQEDWLSFNEQVFLPAQVYFICNKDRLYQFEKDHPQLEPIIKALLRSYEGIYDMPVGISEKMIGGIIRQDALQVRHLLMQLNDSGIIEYQPQKDNPQVYFNRDRVKSSDLGIDVMKYQKRKEISEKRMNDMISFLRNDKICRSKIIGQYFGDKQIKDCGICDNCLRKKKQLLDNTEFEKLRLHILEVIKEKPVTVYELSNNFNSIKKENALTVLEFLQSEKILKIDEQGRISLLT